MRSITFGYPGDGGLGERLLAAVLTGTKTATSSLAVEYLDGTPLPRVGERLTLVDHAGRSHGVVVTTRVFIVALSAVGDDVAIAEGEDFTGAQAWRAAHVAFWQEVTRDIRLSCGDPDWVLGEHEPVVVEWFALVSDPV